jgi:hypothetical protein
VVSWLAPALPGEALAVLKRLRNILRLQQFARQLSELRFHLQGRRAEELSSAVQRVHTDSGAWFGSSYFADRVGRRLPHVVVLGAGASVKLVLHECAHAWHAALPDEARPPAIGVQGCTALLQLEGWRERFDEHNARGERLANACAFVWER